MFPSTALVRSAVVRSTVVAGLALGAVTPAHAEYDLTLCGASPGGLWSLLGAGIDAALKAGQPGSTVTYQTSGGGFANVALLAQNKCDIALIHDAEAIAAIRGKDPFKQPMNHLRTVAVMYTWAPMQMIVSKAYAQENGLKSMEDIATKKLPIRVLLNRRGNVASGVGDSMLAAVGADADAIKSWGGQVTYAASKEQGELMRDRRADAMLNSLFVGHGSIKQLASAIDLALLPISDAAAAKVKDEWKIGSFTIPAASYDWNDAPVGTVTLAAQLFVNENADPKMVADLTAALIAHADKVRDVHKAMAALDAKLMGSGTAVPYHPLAEKAYQAAGLR